jgi:hypothetical protein
MSRYPLAVEDRLSDNREKSGVHPKGMASGYPNSCLLVERLAILCRPAKQTATTADAKSFDLSISRGRQVGNSNATNNQTPKPTKS